MDGAVRICASLVPFKKNRKNLIGRTLDRNIAVFIAIEKLYGLFLRLFATTTASVCSYDLALAYSSTSWCVS